MKNNFSFICAQCGQIHDGSPSFGFSAPAPYSQQSDAVKRNGKLDTDLCFYSDEEGSHYFIRVVLEVPIHGMKEPFLWGVWVSLSEQNYNQYINTYGHPDTNDQYFGWLCNYLPYYPNTYALKTTVHPRANGDRPHIVLHECGHPLAIDFRDGISLEKAVEIVKQCAHKT